MKKAILVPMMLICFILSSISVFATENVDISNKTAIYLISESNKAMRGVNSYEMLMDMYLDLTYNEAGYDYTDKLRVFDVKADAIYEGGKGAFVVYDAGFFGYYTPIELFINENGSYTRSPEESEEWTKNVEFDERAFQVFNMTLLQMFDMSRDTADITEFAPGENLFVDKLQYKKNAVINGAEYYVVSSSIDVNEYGQLIKKELAKMYEEDAELLEQELFSLEGILSTVTGRLAVNAYINKETFLQDIIVISLQGSINNPETGMTMDIDALLKAEMININSAKLPEIDLPTE